MKKCLFFFLALVLAIALETMIGSAVVDDVQAQTVSNYIKEEREVQDITPEWSPLELKETEVRQSQNP